MVRVSACHAEGRGFESLLSRTTNLINYSMKFFHVEYFPIFIFLIVSIVLACVIFGLSYVVSAHASDSEKLSTYECGFDPYEDSRNAFDIRFYLVAILFIIFDLEISFLFPWSLTLSTIGFTGFWSMAIFLLVLTLGFLYEWKKGALEWE